MQTEIKDFTRETLADAQAIAAKMFTIPVGELIENLLDNPVNADCGCTSYGEIAYQDGVPVAFRAAILKRLYLGQEPLLGVVGSTFCSDKSTSPVVLMKLLKKNVGSRAGSRFFFTNTSCEASMKLNKLVGIKLIGPASCGQIRFAVFRWGGFLRLASRGKFPRFAARLMDMLSSPLLACFRLFSWRSVGEVRQTRLIDPSEYNRFWQTYLKSNKGLVCSRTAGELEWAFGKFLRKGSLVIMEYREQGALKGYIAAKEISSGRWMIYDWIALEDERKILAVLMKGLFRYLDCERKAVLIEAIGFPMTIHPLLAKLLPLKRFTAYNTVAYGFQDKDMVEKVGNRLERSWFFGAYDGDRYLG